MPPTGITHNDMLSAIAALQESGKPISKNTVRRQLGNTGSFETISSFLRTWREGQSEERTELSAETQIPETIQALFSKAWLSAQAAAQTELTQQREVVAREADGLKVALSKIQKEHEEALQVLEIQMASLEMQLAESAAREKSAQIHNGVLAESVGYQKRQLEEAESKMTTLLIEKESKILELETQLTELRGLELPTQHG